MTESVHSQFDDVNKAFSSQAPLFDRYEHQNTILQWMRKQVHLHMEQFLRPGDSLLDINAGTGIDAVYFAQQGYAITAVDLSEGMVGEIKKKISALHLTEKISTRQCSFTKLSSLSPKKFHHAFSNFGGLNCIDDLSAVAEQLLYVLHPGAFVTLVIMPVICPWEMLHLLKGNFSLAFRRFHPDGIMAHVEGHYFKTYYHTFSDIKRSFAEKYKTIHVRGLASVSPPPYMEKFPGKFPRLYRSLTAFDERWAGIRPLNRWADHIIVTLQKND